MSDEQFTAFCNVMNSPAGDGQSRLDEAIKWAADSMARNGDPAPGDAIGQLAVRIEERDIRCGCIECREWNGMDHRCSCGNRRVAWAWNGSSWEPETY